jgi:hypothetical protein
MPKRKKRIKRTDTKVYLAKVAKKTAKHDWLDVRAKVLARDNDKCVICGNNVKPNVHHIIGREIKQYRTDINNLVTLCSLHHRFCRKLSAHKQPLAFLVWLEINRGQQYTWAKEAVKKIYYGIKE